MAPAILSAGTASSQCPPPPRRSRVATAEARIAAPLTNTSRGSPVEPEVRAAMPGAAPSRASATARHGSSTSRAKFMPSA
ncbi:hypothetical protein [Demequina litorisediminis]|uniref:hypothetical protein n=1 Tax=Demequina litorisediminis TaxID=1849022 RepID=UPI0024E1982E|nr:hypothetical protein [Demequina litorisediminis]